MIEENSTVSCCGSEEVMDLALQAGHILLENGAEIFRVEETMERICRHFGLQSGGSLTVV